MAFLEKSDFLGKKKFGKRIFWEKIRFVLESPIFWEKI
jgi:hypothetical protein